MSRRDWPLPPRDRDRDRDREQRRQAARLAEVFPYWVVLWGPWSRRFWAFPCFGVPRGTIAHSPDPGELASRMRAVERFALDDRGWPGGGGRADAR